jgi:hypothetical protein
MKVNINIMIEYLGPKPEPGKLRFFNRIRRIVQMNGKQYYDKTITLAEYKDEASSLKAFENWLLDKEKTEGCCYVSGNRGSIKINLITKIKKLFILKTHERQEFLTQENLTKKIIKASQCPLEEI